LSGDRSPLKKRYQTAQKRTPFKVEKRESLEKYATGKNDQNNPNRVISTGAREDSKSRIRSPAGFERSS